MVFDENYTGSVSSSWLGISECSCTRDARRMAIQSNTLSSMFTEKVIFRRLKESVLQVIQRLR
jgi:hypothetical protein